MPALVLVLNKCQYMGHISAGLQHSALQLSNLRPCRNYKRIVLVHCDVRTSVNNQQINQPALSIFPLKKLDNSGNGTSTFLDIAFYTQMSTLGMAVFHLHDYCASRTYKTLRTL